LVLVNYGDAKGQEIADLACQIQADVDAKFGIKLIPEVNFIA
jgi:UDP-N-acetylmuramate dehydrogenase